MRGPRRRADQSEEAWSLEQLEHVLCLALAGARFRDTRTGDVYQLTGATSDGGLYLTHRTHPRPTGRTIYTLDGWEAAAASEAAAAE